MVSCSVRLRVRRDPRGKATGRDVVVVLAIVLAPIASYGQGTDGGSVVRVVQDAGTASAADAGRRVTLTGDVRDVAGRPVSGVSVFAVISKTSTLTASAISGT